MRAAARLAAGSWLNSAIWLSSGGVRKPWTHSGRVHQAESCVGKLYQQRSGRSKLPLRLVSQIFSPLFSLAGSSLEVHKAPPTHVNSIFLRLPPPPSVPSEARARVRSVWIRELRSNCFRVTAEFKCCRWEDRLTSAWQRQVDMPLVGKPSQASSNSRRACFSVPTLANLKKRAARKARR